MQTGGQVSSAPVRQGFGAGRECLASEGSPRLAPTRASSASSSSSTQPGHTAPPPPGQKNVYFCTASRPPQVLPRRSQKRKWEICHRCRRGAAGTGEYPQPKTSVRGCIPDTKPGDNSRRKKDSARVIYPNREPPYNPLKKPQAKPLLEPWATQTPPYSASELPPTPRGAPRLGMWQSWKRVHLFGSRHSAVSPTRRKLMRQFATRRWRTHPEGRQREVATSSLPVATSVTLAASLIPLTRSSQSPRP